MSVATQTETSASAQSGQVLSVNNIEVIYDHVILVLKGVSLDVPKRRHRGAARRQWRRQDHHAEGDLQSAACRARRRHQGLDPVRRRRGAGSVAQRTGAARLHPGDGRPPVLRPSHHRGKPAHRRLHAPRRQGGDPQGYRPGLFLFPQARRAARVARRLHLRRRAADVRHRPRADVAAEDDPARRAVDGAGAADRRGDFRDRARISTRRKAFPSCSPSRTPTWRCASRATATSWRTAAW